MEFYILTTVKLIVGLVVVLLILRLLGRKELAQITPMDMVFVVMLASIYAGMATDNSVHVGRLVITLLIWGVLILILERIKSRKKIHKILEGEPKIIVSNGKVNRDLLERENMTEKELKMQLRSEGIFHIEEVELAILEISGYISVKRKE
ncbi:DUF421 domain-containing protein [Ornithinibacillus halotolerans]|uniref:DUF421 domain-containing protein n=1 Tax=Ornithinibacillus halotolerans TaxID=1274357 RepID=A0A916WA63_9BACI|nr:YetF domain-containing protein [Ornithinibacillus halotolerans]GGA79600.1 hypothetical protein GCM10008025_23750 [Ornithinibacillus halotolerans]